MKNESTKEQENKIKISGTPAKYDPAILQARCDEYTTFYKATSTCCEEVTKDNPRCWLQAVIDKSKEGFVLNADLPIRMEYMHPSALFYKPQQQQEKELEAAYAKLKAVYIGELELEHEGYRLKLIQQMKQADDLKIAEKAAADEAKRLAGYEAKALACYTPLVIPKD